MPIIPKNFFFKKFSKKRIKMTKKGARIDFDFSPVGISLDRAQDDLDAQVWADMQKYMPRQSGNLIAQTGMLNAVTRGSVYAYDPSVEYGHYMYEGEKYVDPVYRVGGFYSPDYGFWSRPGVTKIPSGEPLFYNNPMAEAHWDEVALENHEKEWVNVVKRALRE